MTGRLNILYSYLTVTLYMVQRCSCDANVQNQTRRLSEPPEHSHASRWRSCTHDDVTCRDGYYTYVENENDAFIRTPSTCDQGHHTPLFHPPPPLAPPLSPPPSTHSAPPSRVSSLYQTIPI